MLSMKQIKRKLYLKAQAIMIFLNEGNLKQAERELEKMLKILSKGRVC